MRPLGNHWRLSCWSLLLVAFLSISVAANAQISLSSTSVSFGSVQVGSSTILSAAVSNTGRSTLTISQVLASGIGFSFVGPTLPITLSPQQSAKLSIAFSPQAAGSFSGSLAVTFSGSWGGQNKLHTTGTTIALSGSGTVATVTTPGYLNAPSSLIFSNSVLVGSSQTQALTVTNSGGSNLSISSANVSGSSFTVKGLTFPYTLAAGASASLSVVFAPIVAGTATGTLTLSSNASDPSFAVALSGTATTSGYLSAPSSLIFSNSVLVGSSQTQALTLTNSGGSSLSISSAIISGSGFSVSGLNFPYTLAAGSSVSLSVVFSPTVVGTASATLSLSSNASDPTATVALSGTGASSSSTVGVTPGSMSFGSVTIGSSQSQSGSVTASGGSVTLSSASSSNAAFTLGGLNLPLTIASGQSIPFTITFSPTATGTASAKVSFFTSTSTSASETVSGSGATIQHTVDLSWNASTSTSIVGYNVYRASSAGGTYTKINSSVNPSMSFSDSTVQSGQTYYYVTTAVNSSGVESSYSNQVQAAVPMP
jgi:hypothetical protein